MLVSKTDDLNECNKIAKMLLWSLQIDLLYISPGLRNGLRISVARWKSGENLQSIQAAGTAGEEWPVSRMNRYISI